MNLPHTPISTVALRLSLIFVVLLSASATPTTAEAQVVAPEPRREQLLNGLKLLLVARPGDPQVWMKLRVHSGAAFDLAGKDGLTTLLADALFPDPSTRTYVAEELGGQLDVRTTYDAIDVTISGNASEFDRLAEVLRNAVLQMRLAPQDVRRLSEARLKAAKEAPQTAARLADRAILSRLFGTYPYGRSIAGTPDSIARIDRADLMLARDRFITPNNSTLVVVGGVEPGRAVRTFRQFLGSWHKSEAVPPATFKQPDAPDARTLVVTTPGASDAEVRLAARGVSRSDRDRAAATLLAAIAAERLKVALKDGKASNVSASHTPHALTGVFMVSATAPAASSAATIIEAARAVLSSLASAAPAPGELERAKREALKVDEIHRAGQYPFADVWLDSITYNYDASIDARAFNNVTTVDIGRVAARLFRDAQFATVVAGEGAELRAALANLPGGVEAFSPQRPPAPPAVRPLAQPTPRRP